MKIELSEDNAKTLAELAAKSDKTPEAYLNDYLASEREHIEKIRRDETEDGLWRIYISSTEYPELDGLGLPVVFHQRREADKMLEHVACCLSNEIKYYLDYSIDHVFDDPEGVVRRGKQVVVSTRVDGAGEIDNERDRHYSYRYEGRSCLTGSTEDVGRYLMDYVQNLCMEIADARKTKQQEAIGNDVVRDHEENETEEERMNWRTVLGAVAFFVFFTVAGILIVTFLASSVKDFGLLLHERRLAREARAAQQSAAQTNETAQVEAK